MGKKCALDLASLVSSLTYPIAFLASISGENLRSFAYAMNSEIQLAVIRIHTTHADAKLCDLCTIWAAMAEEQTVKYEVERQTIFNGGDDFANSSLISCARKSLYRLVT